MSTSLYEDIFYQFKRAALEHGCYPASHEPDAFYLNQFRRWQDVVEFRKVALPEREGLKFNVAWVLTPMSRPEHKRRKNSKVTTLIIGGHTVTGRLNIIVGETPYNQLERTVKPEALAEMIIDADRKKYISGYTGRETRQYIGIFLRKLMARLGFQLVSKIDSTHRKLGLTRREQKKTLHGLAAWAAHDVLREKRVSVEADIDQIVNHDAMAFAEEFNTWNYANFNKHYSPLETYNHLVSAPSSRAMDFRKGALKCWPP